MESIEPAQSHLLNADTENSFANTTIREGVSFLHALLHSFVNVLFHMDSNCYCIFNISGGQMLRFGALREKINGENIFHLVKTLLAFPLKLFVFVGFLLPGYWQRQNNVVVPESSINNQVLECLDRLKKMEEEFTEISRKPVKIPEANEKLLTESLERIKSLELDLDKTKSVRNSLDLELISLLSLLNALSYNVSPFCVCLLGITYNINKTTSDHRTA